MIFLYLCSRNMEKSDFEAALQQQAELIEKIRQSAYDLHKSVNQSYGHDLPYGYHLDMVAEVVREFGHLVCAEEADALAMVFAAYYHDSIEDARLTYNDVRKTAQGFMSEQQALTATEIVYALTNDKGRNRAERAGEKYYAGIRSTPYAPFIKACDRAANVTFSCSAADSNNQRMKGIYRDEMPHFLAAINPHSPDIRFAVPKEIEERMAQLLEG